MEDVHIVSWNVAGLKPTVDQLRKFGLKEFFQRHQAFWIRLN